MGKKVLILSSSPRRSGNSDLLCDRFAEGAGKAGHQVEKIRLAEKKIGYCTACYACRKGKCPQQDDAPEILEKMLAADGINAEIINIHTIKPLDRELVVKSALKTGKVVTVEEHSVIGGLGSAVCDVLCEEAPTKVLKIGINDVFGESGPALELIKKYGLDAEGIYKKVKAFVK